MDAATPTPQITYEQAIEPIMMLDGTVRMVGATLDLISKRTASVHQAWELMLHTAPADLPQVAQDYISHANRHYAEAAHTMMDISNSMMRHVIARQRV